MQGANKRRPARGGDQRIAKGQSRGRALCLLSLVVLIWLVPAGLRAEVRLELQYTFDRFAAFPELADARVNAVVDDEDGTIWIGTQDGLFQFDGANVWAHRTASHPGALLDNHVLSLLIDRQGRIWVGTMQGLDRFDPETGAFIATQTNGESWPSGVAVLSLLEAEDGGIWAGTADAGLYRLTAEGETLAHYGAVSDGGVLSTPDVWDLELDSESGYIWVATEGGLDRLDVAAGEVDRRLIPPGDDEHLRQRRTVTSVSVDGDRELWLTTLAGAWRFDRETGRFESLEGWSESLGGSQTHVLDAGRDGLWFSSLESGVVHCPRGGRDCRGLLHEATRSRSLPTNAVRRIHRDHDGRLWLASNDGLARFLPQRLQWGHFRFSGLDDGQPEIWAVTRWRDGLYLGTFGQGLWRADWQALKSRAASVAVERVALAHDTPWSLRVDSADRLWVSTFGGGLFRFDSPAAEPRQWRHDPDDPDSISFDHVWHVTEDEAGLWAGTYGGGLDLLDPASGRRLDNWFPDADPSISSRRVPLVFRDGQDRLWAATYGGGLNRLPEGSEDFRAWRHEPSDPDSLPHDFVVDLAEGPNGSLWVATEGGGLARLVDADAGRFDVHGEEAGGLLNASLSGLRFTPDGALWISHKRGLQRRFEGNWRSIRAADGLQSDDFATRSHAAPEPGWLVFGGRGGINVFDSQAVALPASPSAPRIQQVTLLSGQQREQRSFAAAADWRLDADIDAIELRFSSYFMESEQQPVFRYRLNGGSWVEQREARISLTGLAPGRYQLDLQAALADRQWSSTTSWTFGVRPPWWASHMAWAIYALVALLLVWLGVRYRMRRVAAHNRHLKTLLRARSREHHLRVRAMEATHRQNVSEELLAQKRRLFASLAHELRTPLTALALTVDAELHDDGDLDRRSEALQAVRTNVRRLTRVSQQILSLSDIVADHHQRTEIVDLEAELKTISGALRALLAERRIDLSVDVPEAVHLELKPGSLELILFNLIDNAWKYAGDDARIDIRARAENGQCLLEIADNGPGMSTDFAYRAFDRRAREATQSREDGQGLGLAAVRAMVHANQGDVALETGPGQGCRYIVRLPLAQPDESASFETQADATAPIAPPDSPLGSVLLVEDDAELRRLMERLLAPDWTVLATGDGSEALAWTREQLPDLVVADVDLPGLRGDELCRRVKADAMLAHIPVLLVSALDSPDHQAAGFAALADDYITKPFDAQALRARLRNLWQTLERNREYARRNLLGASAAYGDESSFVDKVRRQAEMLLERGRLSVDNLAETLHVSPRHLARLFARQLGDLTPRQYIDQLHAHRAGERIAAGTTLEQVAEELGYSSSSYLSRKFKQWYGISVREFRHRNAGRDPTVSEK